MPEQTISIPHRLAQDEAVMRFKEYIANAKERYADVIMDVHDEWNDHTCIFRFSAMGFSVSGTLCVRSSEVEILGKLPLAAAPFRGKIESAIRRQVEMLLA